MASKRGDAKIQVEQWAKLFEPYLQKDMTLSFASKFSFTIRIERIELAKTTKMNNAPDKRIDGEKRYTPAVMQIITNAGILRFVIEDTTVLPLYNGIRLTTATTEVDLRLVDANTHSK